MSGTLLIVGSGGHAKVVIATARAAGYRPIAVLDDDQSRQGMTLLGVPVLGSSCELERSEHPAVVAIGDNQSRQRIVEQHPNVTWATLVHPRAFVDGSAALGVGTVVFAGAVIQPDVRVGHHVIINTSASVDHDCDIQDFAQVAPGAHLGGTVTLGRGSFVGIGSTLHQGAELGPGAILGGGAFLKGSVPAGMTAVGVPARVLSPRD